MIIHNFYCIFALHPYISPIIRFRNSKCVHILEYAFSLIDFKINKSELHTNEVIRNIIPIETKRAQKVL